ncbi:AraC family transcriptional regulator [Algoriphagus sp. NF]|jgi:AraC-like DNA-binding protein|uniref:AraC family transcriptional regulator n=1 Tax=Algoriphagus formosus TaxID=2007308 RepID=A0A4R5URE5_9BACT|nr:MULTISPECIES: AraC family transcriptional regulator [Algoriphagus]MCR9081996.1 AraC family transcriptional regulator [Cyclobacteriaceae bacterium]MDE0558518.1 AraC family transcriptional regulator [Algoriphagus sp. NF]TDK41648.1 AraC family transcriptional regulator [Algoriphagus aquimaris]
MSQNNFIAGVPWRNPRDLKTLVENRTTYTLDSCELNIFETHQEASDVNLVFGDLVLTTMLKGKKVMHLFDRPGFDYLPGESVIVPPNEVMKIDFPEAQWDNPTQCIALSISKEMIENTFNMLNERLPDKVLSQEWGLDLSYFHLINTQDLSEIINRFIKIGVKERSKEKDLIASLALKELLIRLNQTQAREMLQKTYKELSSGNRLAHVVDFIKKNIRENLTLEQLASQACMSKAHFVRTFKQELGQTPVEFILSERLKLARYYLQIGGFQVKEVAVMSGFNSIGYFIRAFKQEYGTTPKSFQKQ